MVDLSFTSPQNQKPGLIASILECVYAPLLESDPRIWEPERTNWEEYDREIFEYPETVGKSIFLSQLADQIVGFASWDPRQRPRYGIIGHNCILPKFCGRGYGKRQIEEVLRRFAQIGIETARVSTNDYPFFIPAQRMYESCGFREVRRIPWKRDPERRLIEYERKIG